jgi:hypothetical protein
MKILKYLLMVVIVIALYITYPLWQLTPGTGSDIPQIDEEKVEAKPRMSEDDKALREAEEKFGPKPRVAYKSRVPEPVQRHWDETLEADESIYEDICSRLKVTAEGWSTTCQFKVKSEKGISPLRFKSYTIKNGQLVK